MTFKSCSTKEIISIIKSLKTKNSFGYDEISTKILKISATFISSPLTYICNKSISSGIFPERLKYSIIKPLYKKGDRTDLSNYRPISILTSFSKVLEKVLYKQLMEYLNNNNILFTRPPLWSSDQSFWLQIQRSRVRSPALPDFLSSSGSGTGSTQPREVN